MRQTTKQILVAVFLMPVIVGVAALLYVMWPVVVLIAVIAAIVHLISTYRNRHATI